MTATLFTLRLLGSGEVDGVALVCPDARYCSVRSRHGQRLDRRFATPRDWRALERELSNLPRGALSDQSITVRVLTGRDLSVQYLVSEDIEAAPADLANVLDALLNAQTFEPPSLTLMPTP